MKNTQPVLNSNRLQSEPIEFLLQNSKAWRTQISRLLSIEVAYKCAFYDILSYETFMNNTISHLSLSKIVRHLLDNEKRGSK